VPRDKMSATTCWGWRALSLGRLVSPQPKSKPLASYKWYTHGGEALRWHRMQNGRVRRASRAASGCHAERREQRWAGPKARQSLPSGSHSQCDLEAVIRDLPSAESKEAEMGSRRGHARRGALDVGHCVRLQCIKAFLSANKPVSRRHPHTQGCVFVV
jgi:hypothetical protein